jgi:hypothetical protein
MFALRRFLAEERRRQVLELILELGGLRRGGRREGSPRP